MLIEFTKMHGLGNDFMVIDLVTQELKLNKALVRLLGDRHIGIGFDQLLIVEPPSRPDVDFDYRIFNQDGSEVSQCGNGARCFASFVQVRKLSFKNCLQVQTKSGVITLRTNSHGWVQVDMGQPSFTPQSVAFSPQAITKIGNAYRMDISGHPMSFYICSMGNPHAVIKVDNVLSAEVNHLGKHLSTHEAFKEGVNVGFMQVMSTRHIRLRVFERGVGETQACGSGACAAVAVGVQEKLLDAGEDIRVQLFGGSLAINHTQGQSVLMTGPTSFVYEGVFSPDGLAAQAGINLDDEII